MNLFFLLSFIPALAYWVVELVYDEQTAIMWGVGLAFLELIIEKVFTKKVHSLSVLNAGLMVFLGAMGFFFQEGALFKLQPTFTGLIFFVAFFLKTRSGGSYFHELLEEMGRSIPADILKFTERNLAFFMLTYGSFMAYVTFTMETGTWLFFKTGGFYIASAIFMVLNTLYLRKIRKNPSPPK